MRAFARILGGAAAPLSLLGRVRPPVGCWGPPPGGPQLVKTLYVRILMGNLPHRILIFHGFPWISIDFQWKSMDFNGFQWILGVLQGASRDTPWGVPREGPWGASGGVPQGVLMDHPMEGSLLGVPPGLGWPWGYPQRGSMALPGVPYGQDMRSCHRGLESMPKGPWDHAKGG